jgi:hypothetical protein
MIAYEIEENDDVEESLESMKARIREEVPSVVTEFF